MKSKFYTLIGKGLPALVLLAGSLQAAEPVALKIGHLPVTGHAKFFVALEEGFFKDAGLNVELVEFANSADGLAALRAGKLDAGAFGTTAPLVHISKGADLRIISGVMGEDIALIVTKENAANIKSLADLKGKKIATIRLATGDAVVRGALDKIGINWKTDVQIFELKAPPAVLEAVKTGQVDVGVTWGPHDVRAVKEGLVVISRSRDLEPGHPCCRLVVNADEVTKRPEVWEKFVHAFLRAEKFASENHDKTIDDIAKHVKLDRSILEAAYYGGFLDQSSDPNVEGVNKFWKTMNKSEFVKSDLDINNYIVVDIYKKALDRLAKEEPSPFWESREKVFAQRDVLKKSATQNVSKTPAIAVASVEKVNCCTAGSH